MTSAGYPPDATVYVAGMPVLRSSVPDLIDRVWADVAAGEYHVYISINANSTTLRREFPGYAETIADPRAVCVADGVSITLGGALFGQRKIGRVPGVDVLEQACAKAAEDGTTFFLLGGDPGVAESLRTALERRFEGLQITGIATPPYGEWPTEESARLTDLVRESGANVVWMGVAAGKQEVWAMRHAEEMGTPVVCVGAAFDFLSGRKHRAPHWMRRAGLEWMHRFASEPGRLWRRYTVGNAMFLADLVRYGRRPA